MSFFRRSSSLPCWHTGQTATMTFERQSPHNKFMTLNIRKEKHAALFCRGLYNLTWWWTTAFYFVYFVSSSSFVNSSSAPVISCRFAPSLCLLPLTGEMAKCSYLFCFPFMLQAPYFYFAIHQKWYSPGLNLYIIAGKEYTFAEKQVGSVVCS